MSCAIRTLSSRYTVSNLHHTPRAAQPEHRGPHPTRNAAAEHPTAAATLTQQQPQNLSIWCLCWCATLITMPMPLACAPQPPGTTAADEVRGLRCCARCARLQAALTVEVRAQWGGRGGRWGWRWGVAGGSAGGRPAPGGAALQAHDGGAARRGLRRGHRGARQRMRLRQSAVGWHCVWRRSGGQRWAGGGCGGGEYQPWPKGGNGILAPLTLRAAASNLKSTRCGPATAMPELTMKAPSGGNVITFCSVLSPTSITCGRSRLVQSAEPYRELGLSECGGCSMRRHVTLLLCCWVDCRARVACCTRDAVEPVQGCPSVWLCEADAHSQMCGQPHLVYISSFCPKQTCLLYDEQRLLHASERNVLHAWWQCVNSA